MKKLALVAFVMLVGIATVAFQTSNYPVAQTGSVTANHMATWSADHVLKDGGTAAAGTVTGPGSSTNNDIAVFNGTTGIVLADGGGPLPANTTATANNFFTAYTQSTGVFTKARPACADLSDSAATCSSAAIGGITGMGTGVGTFLATPSSANLASALTDETGSGLAMFGTSPRITTSMLDTNGNAMFAFTATASAVDGFTFTNAATANPATVTIAATGTDTNIHLSLLPKGNGGVVVPLGTAANPIFTNSTALTTGIFFPSSTTIAYAFNGVEKVRQISSEINTINAGGLSWSATTTLGSRDSAVGRFGPGAVSIDTSTIGNGLGLVVSGNKMFVTGDFTTAANTSLQTITGLSKTLPASTAVNLSFHCSLNYSQGTGTAAVAFGIQGATTAPTQINANGVEYTSATVFAAGTLNGLATTTATNIVSATPSAITTVWKADLDGTIEAPSNASPTVLNFMVSTATSGDAVTIKRGSYCNLM